MQTLNVKSNKVGREIDIPAPEILSLSGQALVDALGMETTTAYLLDKIKIATRAKVRGMLEKTGKDEMSDDDIRQAEQWNKFVPQHQERTSPEERLAKDLKKLDPAALKRLLAELG